MTKTATPSAVRLFLTLPATYRRWALLAVIEYLPPELEPQSAPVIDLLISRWGNVRPFAGLDTDTLRTVMATVVTNVSFLGVAMDAGDMTHEQATDIGVATIASIARAAAR